MCVITYCRSNILAFFHVSISNIKQMNKFTWEIIDRGEMVEYKQHYLYIYVFMYIYIVNSYSSMSQTENLGCY